MKKTATQAGSGQDSQSCPSIPANTSFGQCRKRLQKGQVDLKPSALQLLATARRHVQACLEMPELQDLTLTELEYQLAHTRTTAAFLEATRCTLLQASETEPGLGGSLDALIIWQMAIGSQMQGIERFFRLELGTPSAAEIEFDFGCDDG